MNGYVCFYKLNKNSRIEVYADSSYAAQQKAAVLFKAKRIWDVTVLLAEHEGDAVVHDGSEV